MRSAKRRPGRYTNGPGVVRASSRVTCSFRARKYRGDAYLPDRNCVIFFIDRVPNTKCTQMR
jgi:hypothetical protein